MSTQRFRAGTVTSREERRPSVNHPGTVGSAEVRSHIFPAVREAAHQGWGGGKSHSWISQPPGFGHKSTPRCRDLGWTQWEVRVKVRRKPKAYLSQPLSAPSYHAHSWGKGLMTILLLGPHHFFAYMCRAQSCLTLCNPLIPWTIACQTPLSMAFSRQEFWSGSPFPTPGDLPDSGIEAVSLVIPELAGRFFITSATFFGHFYYGASLVPSDPLMHAPLQPAGVRKHASHSLVSERDLPCHVHCMLPGPHFSWKGIKGRKSLHPTKLLYG